VLPSPGSRPRAPGFWPGTLPAPAGCSPTAPARAPAPGTGLARRNQSCAPEAPCGPEPALACPKRSAGPGTGPPVVNPRHVPAASSRRAVIASGRAAGFTLQSVRVITGSSGPADFRRRGIAVHDVGQYGPSRLPWPSNGARVLSTAGVQGWPRANHRSEAGLAGLAPDAFRGAQNPWRAHDHGPPGVSPGSPCKVAMPKVGQHGPALGSDQDVAGASRRGAPRPARPRAAACPALRASVMPIIAAAPAGRQRARPRPGPGPATSTAPVSMMIHGVPSALDHVVHGDYARVAQAAPATPAPPQQRPLPQHVPVLVGHRAGDPDLLDRDLAIEAQIPGPPTRCPWRRARRNPSSS